jgi:hypothetical protein
VADQTVNSGQEDSLASSRLASFTSFLTGHDRVSLDSTLGRVGLDARISGARVGIRKTVLVIHL